MGRVLGLLLIGLFFLTGVPGWSAVPAAAESEGQLRMAYHELTRVRSLSSPGSSFRDYREAVLRARGYVGLLSGGDAKTLLLRRAMGIYERALALWSLKEDSDSAVDSLRTDQAQGAALLRECPDIPRFHYKWRDQIYVMDGVACVWAQAAEVLDQVPATLR